MFLLLSSGHVSTGPSLFHLCMILLRSWNREKRPRHRRHFCGLSLVRMYYYLHKAKNLSCEFDIASTSKQPVVLRII